MPSRSFFTRHLWMFLVMLALAARGSIPMGYMLDAAALQAGSLRLVLCSFDLPASQPLQHQAVHPGPLDQPSAPPDHTTDHHSHHRSASAVALDAPQPASHDGDVHDQACPFGVLMAQGLGIPPIDGVVVLRLPVLAPAPLPGAAPQSLPPLPALGPPLGSRAPPLFLG